MLNMNLSLLVASLGAECRQALEESAAACVERGGHEIGIEDFLDKLSETGTMQNIAAQFNLDLGRLRELCQKTESRRRTDGRPVFSTLLVEFLQEAYLLNSLELQREHVDTFTLVLSLLRNPARYSLMRFYRELSQINADALQQLMAGLDSEGQITDSPMSDSGLNESHTPKHGNMKGAETGNSYCKKYTTDFIQEARSGKIDPVFARGPEIRQMIDILSRRRKNNPILVGDPGVGKTAVVEGLALKIAEGNVPDALKGVRVIGLDMGRLQAGASVKGEFEKRLKSIVDEIKASPVPTILFIDEAHMLVGAGNEAGGGDAANLLKPALARGELRTIAATTWSEYKKYFEKDAALARRFQLVKLDQPDAEETATILRGIVPHYEKNHHVYIRDDAVVATAVMSTRYISGRQQPDKAIDVLDTACARVKVSLGAKPAVLEAKEEELAAVKREIDALERDACRSGAGLAAVTSPDTRADLGVSAHVSDDSDSTPSGASSPDANSFSSISSGTLSSAGRNSFSAKHHAELQKRFATLKQEIEALGERWAREKELVRQILVVRTENTGTGAFAAGPSLAEDTVTTSVSTSQSMGKTCEMAGRTKREGGATEEAVGTHLDVAGGLADAGNGALEKAKKTEQLVAELKLLQGADPLVFYEVSPALVASIIAEWTGIPVTKLSGDAATRLSGLTNRLRERVKGQDYALETLEKAVLAARTDMHSPTSPTAIMLLVGPSGVGKTETALAVADELYGGENMLISINMSEFQEKHTISRLIGSPPGYVGYGEGGRLTEAVRRQPYSVVLFDEVEKAHPDVMNLFYQMFDKGVLSDGEGREIDFRNTMIFLTSNIGGEIVTALCENDTPQDPVVMQEALLPALMQHFKPALLGRMTVVPYGTIPSAVMKELVQMKLERIKKRLQERHQMVLSWSPEVVGAVAASCTAVDTGARNIDHIVNASLLPGISGALLKLMAEKNEGQASIAVGLNIEDGTFSFALGTA